MPKKKTFMDKAQTQIYRAAKLAATAAAAAAAEAVIMSIVKSIEKSNKPSAKHKKKAATPRRGSLKKRI